MKRAIYILCICLSIFMILGCDKNASSKYPTIEYGIAKFSGKITAEDSTSMPKLEDMEFFVMNNILAEFKQYKIAINTDGTFSIEVPVISDAWTELYSKFLKIIMPLSPNDETILNIHFDKNGEKHVSMQSISGYAAHDMISIKEAIHITTRNYKTYPDSADYNMSPEEFKSFISNRISRIPNFIDSIKPDMPDSIKRLTINELQIFYTYANLFDYTRIMQRTHDIYVSSMDTTVVIEPLNIQEPNRAYYSFLKDLNLNDPAYLSTSWYCSILAQIFKTEALNIAPIGDQNPNEWMKDTSEKLKDLVGFDSGLFYDMLLSNSYARQLKSMTPFSDIQKTNIKTYFEQQPAVSTILLAENEEIMTILNKKNTGYNINETPDVSEDKIIESIVARYPNKVVFIDFWATWCAPCLKGMKEIEPLKKKLKDSDIVFVYITNESSPQKLWREKIAEIGSEHYYLKDEIWESISEKFKFDGIPAYLIYDKNGKLAHQQVGMMKAEKAESITTKLVK